VTPGERNHGGSVDRTGPKALTKGLLLLRVLADSPTGLQLAELCRRVGLPKPTTLRLLGPLLDFGLVDCRDGGRYRLGPECLVLGAAFRGALDLRAEAADLLHALVELSGETVHLAVPDRGRVLYVDKVESPHALRMVSRIGGTNPLHCTALGKAMLAFAGEELVRAAVTAGLERRTPRTIVELGQLEVELERVRERGFAIDDVENEAGVRCVGAPVLDEEGRVTAAISVAGPEHRLTRERALELGPRVRAAAEELSRRLGHRGEARLRQDHGDEEVSVGR
jgi:DNA-binding IclR family transcriptional regulator